MLASLIAKSVVPTIFATIVSKITRRKMNSKLKKIKCENNKRVAKIVSSQRKMKKRSREERKPKLFRTQIACIVGAKRPLPTCKYRLILLTNNVFL